MEHTDGIRRTDMYEMERGCYIDIDVTDEDIEILDELKEFGY